MIKRFHCRNYCQLLDLDVTFAPGMNVVIGPNGSGKSNLLKGIFAAFTGDFRQDEGTVADNVNQMAKHGERAELDLWGVHQGTEFCASRWVDGEGKTGRKLKIGDNKAVTADKVFRDELFKFLGVDDDLLDRYVCVAQGQTTELVTQTPAKRSAAWQRLFKLERLGALYDAVGRRVNRSIVAGPSGNRLDLSRDFMMRQAELINCRDLLKFAPDLEHIDQQMAACSQVMSAWSAVATAQGNLSAWRQQLELLNQSIKDGETNCARQQGLIDSAATGMQAASEKVRGLEQAKTGLDAYAAWQQSSQTCDAEITRLQTELASVQAPAPPKDYLPPDQRGALKSSEETLATTIGALKQFVDRFDPTRSPNCPTCGAATAGLVEKWNEAKRELETFRPQLDQIKAQLQSFVRHDVSLGHHNEAMVKLNDRAAGAIGRMNTIRSHEPPRPTLNFQEVTSQLSAARNELNAVQVTHTTAATSQHMLNQQLSQLRQQANNLVSGVAQAETVLQQNVGVTEEAYKQAVDEHAELTQQKVRTATLATDYRAAEDRMNVTKKLLDDYDAAAQKVQHESAVREHFQAMREVLRFDCLPRQILTTRLADLTDEVNECLAVFGSPFSVAVTEDASFSTTFVDRKHGAGRLSEGQRILLGLSVRLAVYRLFVPHVGFLIMDEPTAGLDHENVGYLTRAFERLRDYSHSAGLQVILSTHEKRLVSAFDKVIDLTPGTPA